MPAPLEYLVAVAQARILAILCDGRGADGSLGADAQARSIAAGTFRRVRAPLTDSATADELFHRGLYLRWPGLLAKPAELRRNSRTMETARLDVSVGYVQGAATAQRDLVHVAPDSTDDAAAMALDPSVYAIGDGRRVRIALEWHGLLFDGADTHKILDVQHEGDLSELVLSPTRSIWSQSFAVRLWSPGTPTP